MVNRKDGFETISVKGFRRLQHIELQMRDLMVMIGPNGAGKTSFLDVLSVLAASGNGTLRDTLQLKGGLTEVLTRGKAQDLEIGISMRVSNQEPLKYGFTLSPSPNNLVAYEITNETLTQQRDPNKREPLKYIDSHGADIKYFEGGSGLVRPSWEHDPFETSLSQVPKMYREPENLRKSLAGCTYYGALDVSEKSPIRLPQPMRPATLPGARGEDLVSSLYYLQQTNRDRFEMIEDILGTAFPDFKRLNFPPVAAGTLSMTWTDRNFTKDIYIHELSEGTLRFLWLTALLLSESLTTITLLDEPEVSLHPELLRHLVYLMREASKRTQVVVATHSDRLIRFLEPREILICDLEEGAATMTWADTLDLDRWLEEYTLDQIWAMNLMGGRP
ncbi:AAA family ATPase [Leptolyngbya sp. AN03gr2]|uniref:AAA family ATPase n=1 Tax=unclassified Leptolyngbya TaxID=2650499 RepID=UPI003D31E3A8